MAVSTKKPVVRVVSARSLIIALAGPEQSYPAYQTLSRPNKFKEKPKHNPFRQE